MAAKVQGTWMALHNVGINPDGTVGTTQLYPLGFRVRARDVGTTAYGDGEFIYLTGATSTAAGSVVLITDAYGTSLIAARAIGAVALALGANDASSKYGWYQVLGKGVALCDTVAAAAPCFIDGTSGRIDDAVVAGDAVQGMRTVTTDDTGTCVVNMASHALVGDADNA